MPSNDYRASNKNTGKLSEHFKYDHFRSKFIIYHDKQQHAKKL